MRIPEFLNRDDYLQNPILRRFLKDHRAYPLLRTVQTIFVKSKHIQKEMSVLLQKFVTGYSM